MSPTSKASPRSAGRWPRGGRAGRARLPGSAGLGLSLGLLGGVLVASCQGGGCGGGGRSDAGIVDAGTDAMADALAPDAGDAEAPACTDASPYLPGWVPEGWVRAPCAPGNCEVFIASDPSFARPPSPWAECGPGCLELVHDWGDPSDRLFGELGATDGAHGVIAYTRNLGGGRYETSIVRLPENEVLFDALLPNMGSSCDLHVAAFSSRTALFQLAVDTSDIWIDRRIMFTVSPLQADPRVIFDRTDSLIDLTTVVSEKLWAASYGIRSLHWHDLEPSNELRLAWQSPDTRTIYGLSASGEHVFFHTEDAWRRYGIMVWDPTSGARPLIPAPDGEAGGTCCLVTDGTDMVWLEGHGWDAAAGSFADVVLMHSPFVTAPEALQPKVVRTAYQRTLVGVNAKVAAGYALLLETGPTASDPRQATLTRLADGASVLIEPRPGFHWNWTLYVTAEEVALAEGANTEVFIDAGLNPGETYTIKRLSIESLGLPSG